VDDDEIDEAVAAVAEVDVAGEVDVDDDDAVGVVDVADAVDDDDDAAATADDD